MKTVKLSFTAILALSATTFLNAQPLENAIKNVDVTGTAAYRYNDYEGTSKANNNYKIATSLKSKVNDDVTFNSRVIIGDGTTNPASIETKNADSNAEFGLSEANFAYSGINNTIVTAGKQGIATPFTIARDSIGNEQTGTGLVATTNFNMLTLTGGYFNQTNIKNTVGGNANETALSKNLNGGEDLYFATASVLLSNITFDGTYIEIKDSLDAYTIGLTSKYDVSNITLNPYARYSSLNLDSSDKDNTLWKVGTEAQMGIFGAYLAYGETNEEGGETALDYSSDTGMDDHWRVTLTGISDASVVYASVNAQVTDKVNLALKYSDLNAGSMSNDKDQDEVYAQASYQMSKNFTTYVRGGVYDYNGDSSNMGRVHMQYNY